MVNRLQRAELLPASQAASQPASQLASEPCEQASGHWQRWKRRQVKVGSGKTRSQGLPLCKRLQVNGGRRLSYDLQLLAAGLASPGQAAARSPSCLLSRRLAGELDERKSVRVAGAAIADASVELAHIEPGRARSCLLCLLAPFALLVLRALRLLDFAGLERRRADAGGG